MIFTSTKGSEKSRYSLLDAFMNYILLIDDDPEIVKLNKKYLGSRGYVVRTAACGSEALAHIEEAEPDCIVLDVLLPDVLGFDLCGEIRKRCDTPIIFLSCKDGEDDKVCGLLAGGDDYMTKPFSMRELEVRIHAQIRRNDRILFDLDNKTVMYRTKSVSLSQVEFDLFLILYQKKCLISSEELYASLKGGQKDDSNNIAVYIRRLRIKLADFGESFGTIETVRGEGYRWFEG